MSTDAEEALVEVAGGTLWTATHGTGPPVVLCHGGPGLCDNLAPAADLLSGGARIHRYDQRGNGRSVRAGPLDVGTFVADFEALRTHWGHERWVVGGHSWGAALALFYAVAHPDRTAGVISIAGTGTRWGWQDETRRHRLGRLAEGERQELMRLEACLARGSASAEDEARFLRLMWSTDFVTRAAADAVLDAAPLYRCRRNADVFRALAADQRRMLDTGFDASLRTLEAPVLAVHGDGDAGVHRSREVAQLVPHGQLVVLPDAGHSPWFESPGPFARAVLRFVGSL